MLYNELEMSNVKKLNTEVNLDEIIQIPKAKHKTFQFSEIAIENRSDMSLNN